MKAASFFFAASMAGAVAAQKLSDYFPQCSLNCLEQGTTSATDCSLGDAVCFCVQSNYDAIYNAELACVLKDCGADVSVDKVLPAAVQFCSAASSSASASATETSKAADSTTKMTPTASSEATETSVTQTTSSAQSSAVPHPSATSSTPVASGRPVTSARTTTSFSTAAAAAAGPMVTAVMLVAGAVAMF